MGSTQPTDHDGQGQDARPLQCVDGGELAFVLMAEQNYKEKISSSSLVKTQEMPIGNSQSFNACCIAKPGTWHAGGHAWRRVGQQHVKARGVRTAAYAEELLTLVPKSSFTF